jgi:hypothetical protein
MIEADPMRAQILAAARALRSAHVKALMVVPVAAAVLLYRPISRHNWTAVGVIAALQLLLIAFFVGGIRRMSPRSTVMRALLDEPERIAGVEVRGTAVMVYLSRRQFTLLRPSVDPAGFAATLRARCPNAVLGRPSQTVVPRTEAS